MQHQRPRGGKATWHHVSTVSQSRNKGPQPGRITQARQHNRTAHIMIRLGKVFAFEWEALYRYGWYFHLCSCLQIAHTCTSPTPLSQINQQHRGKERGKRVSTELVLDQKTNKFFFKDIEYQLQDDHSRQKINSRNFRINLNQKNINKNPQPPNSQI